MGLFRNASVVAQVALLTSATIVFTVSAMLAGGSYVHVALTGGLGVLAVAACLGFSRARYREIARLAVEVDEVLHTGRSLEFSSCREGDVAVLRNEIAKMTARLSRTKEQLEHEKSALADAMADISHQIRTPITALCCSLPAIEKADDPAERKRLIRRFEGLLDRIAWLVSALLRMAKIDAGALSVDRRLVDVEAVTSRVVRSLGAAFDVRDVSLDVEVAKGARFLGDERWCAEALENIVKNCMEHTPSGGNVRIDACEDALSTRIVVRDSGLGIHPDDLPYVFDRFYRGSHSSVMREEATEGEAGLARGYHAEGFGIGLALAQALVNAQGGTVRAGNEEGRGARFEIAFPKMVI